MSDARTESERLITEIQARRSTNPDEVIALRVNKKVRGEIEAILKERGEAIDRVHLILPNDPLSAIGPVVLGGNGWGGCRQIGRRAAIRNMER